MSISTKWSSYPNPDIRTLETRHRFFPSYHKYSSVLWQSYTAQQKTLIKALQAVPGVVEIGLNDYTVRINKAAQFTWEEISPQVEFLFSSYLESLQKVVIPHRKSIEVAAENLHQSLVGSPGYLSVGIGDGTLYVYTQTEPDFEVPQQYKVGPKVYDVNVRVMGEVVAAIDGNILPEKTLVQ